MAGDWLRWLKAWRKRHDDRHRTAQEGTRPQDRGRGRRHAGAAQGDDRHLRPRTTRCRPRASRSRRAGISASCIPMRAATCWPRTGCRPKAACCRTIPLPRRMYAGSTFTFEGDIRVGDRLRRETEFSDVQLRGGGTGSLIVTSQTRRIYTPRGLAVTEVANTVFREEVKAGDKERRAGARGCARRRAVAAHHQGRSGDAVPLLGDHLQSASHPLRPDLLHRDRGLSRPGGARPFAQQCLFDLLRDSNPGRRSRPSPSAPARRCSTPRRSTRSAGRPPTVKARNSGP